MLMKTKEKFAVMLVDGQVKYILGTQGLQFPPQYTRGTPMADPAASLSHCHTATLSLSAVTPPTIVNCPDLE